MKAERDNSVILRKVSGNLDGHFCMKMYIWILKKIFCTATVCAAFGSANLKADFERDLLNVLSIEGRGFSKTQEKEKAQEKEKTQEKEKEIPYDPVCDSVCWSELYDLYKAYKDLYEEFCTGIREIEANFKKEEVSATDDNADAFVDCSFSLLKLSRNLCGKVSEYAFEACKFEEDNRFQNVEPLLLLECRYAFVRRLLGLSRCIIRKHVQALDVSAFVDTENLEPHVEILAEILKPFDKGDAYGELLLQNNDSQLSQKLKIFGAFSKANKEILEEIKKVSEGSLSFESKEPKIKAAIKYQYILDRFDELRTALRDLFFKICESVDRMLSVKDKVSAEQKEEALLFFNKKKNKEDVNKLLKFAKDFRQKEKKERKKAQKTSQKKKEEWKKLKSEIVAPKEALTVEKGSLCEITEGTEVLNEKKELEDEVPKLPEEIKTSRKQRNKQPHKAKDKMQQEFTKKANRKMQREFTKKAIGKDEFDRAILANYVQLPGRCGAFQNAFLYCQAILWNVFTNAEKTCLQKIYENLQIKAPLLSDDFEDEYKKM